MVWPSSKQGRSQPTPVLNSQPVSQVSDVPAICRLIHWQALPFRCWLFSLHQPDQAQPMASEAIALLPCSQMLVSLTHASPSCT